VTPAGPSPDLADGDSSQPRTSTPGGSGRRPHVIRRAGWRRWLGPPVVAVALGACSGAHPVDSPPPGGTRPPSSDATVRAPNRTNMGAPPINAGTGALTDH
jgi:hypothetical protein